MNLFNTRAARTAKGLSQKELAEMLGIEQATVSAWECGIATPPASKLASICKALGWKGKIWKFGEKMFTAARKMIRKLAKGSLRLQRKLCCESGKHFAGWRLVNVCVKKRLPEIFLRKERQLSLQYFCWKKTQGLSAEKTPLLIHSTV